MFKEAALESLAILRSRALIIFGLLLLSTIPFEYSASFGENLAFSFAAIFIYGMTYVLCSAILMVVVFNHYNPNDGLSFMSHLIGKLPLTIRISLHFWVVFSFSLMLLGVPLFYWLIAYCLLAFTVVLEKDPQLNPYRFSHFIVRGHILKTILFQSLIYLPASLLAAASSHFLPNQSSGYQIFLHVVGDFTSFAVTIFTTVLYLKLRLHKLGSYALGVDDQSHKALTQGYVPGWIVTIIAAWLAFAPIAFVVYTLNQLEISTVVYQYLGDYIDHPKANLVLLLATIMVCAALLQLKWPKRDEALIRWGLF